MHRTQCGANWLCLCALPRMDTIPQWTHTPTMSTGQCGSVHRIVLHAGLQDLIPYLVRHQHSSAKAAYAGRPDSSAPAANGQHESTGSLAPTESMEQITPGGLYHAAGSAWRQLDRLTTGSVTNLLPGIPFLFCVGCEWDVHLL